MSEFKISTAWMSQLGSVKSEADATMAKLTIEVGDAIATEFVDRRDIVSRYLGIPAYYLAEWIAENWWALLWEPRKSEDDSDSADFLSRHSILSAQHGFALPKVVIVPTGKSLSIAASARDVDLADIRFLRRGAASCSRETVQTMLQSFVSSTVDKLKAANIRDTYLQDAWEMVSETTEDEAQFCRFVGALGKSPYDVDDATASLIEELLPALGDRLLMDLCLVSPAATFAAIAGAAQKAAEVTKYASVSTLSPLASLQLPQDNLSVPAYRRGVNAAQRVRQRLGISDTDPRGATRVFEELRIDTSARTGTITIADDNSITGAVLRHDDEMKVGLLQATEPKRRFAAARAVFSGWSAEDTAEGRFLTSAVTRDQQANRAFAAELTAPLALIRKRARRGLSQNDLFELAGELQIGTDVVAKQASNNGIDVSRV